MNIKKDERGRFCSFNTICGRNCTPREHEQCQWWTHAADERPEPTDLPPPVSHAKVFPPDYPDGPDREPQLPEDENGE